MAEKEPTLYPQVIPEIEDWPIYHLSEDRRNFIEEIDEFTAKRLMNQHGNQLGEMLAKTIYLELIRTKEEPWKVDPPNERQFWKRMSKRLADKSLDRNGEEAAAANRDILARIIHRYSEEIVGTFRKQTFLFARRFLTFFFNRLLNTAAGRRFSSLFGSKYRLKDKLIVQGFTEEVRSLIQKGTVVVVPTHFSNLDSILIGYAMDTFAGLPAFSYGAGLNLYNTGYTAYFMNRLGAYRVDRRKKNPIYLEALKAMANLSIQRGAHNLFFPGGTRSRDGSLETRLKLGLLSTTVEAQRSLYQQGKDHKVYIVPMVLSYPFVLEAQFLIEQHLRRMGKERYIRAKDSFHSLRSILKFIWGVFSKGNDITISFGQPMDVIGNPVDAEGRSFDRHGRQIDVREYFMKDGRIDQNLQRESEYTKILGEAIVERYHKDNIVLSSHLVSFAAFQLLRQQNSRLDLFGILRLPPEDFVFRMDALLEVLGQLREHLRNMEAAGQLRLSEQVRSYELPELIRHGLTRLGNYHINKPLLFNRDGNVVSQSFTLLYYYHNRLSTYRLEKRIRWKEMELLEEVE